MALNDWRLNAVPFSVLTEGESRMKLERMNRWRTVALSALAATLWTMTPLLAKSSNDRSMLDVSHIIATTSNNVDGYRVRNYLGIVRGVIVREPKIMQGFKAELKRTGWGQDRPFDSHV